MLDRAWYAGYITRAAHLEVRALDPVPSHSNVRAGYTGEHIIIGGINVFCIPCFVMLLKL